MWNMKKLSQKTIGFAVMALGLLLLASMLWFLDELADLSEKSCTCGDSCTMEHFEIPLIFYLALAGTIILFILGTILALSQGGGEVEIGENTVWIKRKSKLSNDDLQAFELLMDEGGTCFQADILEKTGWNKSKVTRTLDRLESIGYIERRRRGLTNIIVLTR